MDGIIRSEFSYHTPFSMSRNCQSSAPIFDGRHCQDSGNVGERADPQEASEARRKPESFSTRNSEAAENTDFYALQTQVQDLRGIPTSNEPQLSN
jgi:hypothetical protein